MMPPPPTSTLFPYTTLFRSRLMFVGKTARSPLLLLLYQSNSNGKGDCLWRSRPRILRVSRQILSSAPANGCEEDRKSTRLNSSHITISYAVFCLKKKKKKQH